MKKFSILIVLLIAFVFVSNAKPKLTITDRNDINVAFKWEDDKETQKIIVIHPEKAKAIQPVLTKNYKANFDFDTSKFESFTGKANVVIYTGNAKSGEVKFNGTTAETDYEVDFYYLSADGKSISKNETASFFTSAAKPLKQAKTVAFNKFTDKAFDMIWKRGDGKKCLMVMKKGKGEIADPKNGVEYKADDKFGKGGKTDADSSFVVYNGSGSAVVVSNLEPNSLYTIKVYEYNGSGEKINYQTAKGSFNPNTRTTLLETPTMYKAEDVTATTFLSKWKKVSGGDVYELDLGYDKDFQKTHPDYTAVDVGNLSEYKFEELQPGKYFLRVRAFGNKNHSDNSNVIEVNLK